MTPAAASDGLARAMASTNDRAIGGLLRCHSCYPLTLKERP